MSRSRAFLLSLFVAAVAAAITAGAFLWFDHGTESERSSGSTEILSKRSTAIPEAAAPSTPVLPPTFAEATRTTVDWAAIYARTVPALVSVVTDRGGGSGFFVSTDGHVITNHHVAASGNNLRVVTQQGDIVDAELVAKDLGNDLALLKIDPQGLTIKVPLYADMEDVRVGDPVGALGAPFALPNTLTVGIVSALDRERGNGPQAWEPLRGTIQTDAALNPGNSGGMLIDARGRLIGIPTQIESNGGSSTGIGFAVSVEALLRSLPVLIEGRDVERTFLGVTLDRSNGQLRVGDVFCDSSADLAGVKAGDRLISINDASAESVNELVGALAAITPGEEIVITVRRGWRRVELETTAQAWPTVPLSGGCG